MLLPTSAESQRERASAVGIAGVKHCCAASAEAHGSCLTTLCCFNVGTERAAGEDELVAVDARRELECRGAHGLAIAAMADDDKLGVHGRFPGHIAA